MKGETKEQIKNRMLRKAADLWNIPANEINDSFDPLVSLLIAACASEMEQLSSEINDSQTYVTERLIQLLTPETVFDAKPAHSIAYVECMESKMTISPEYALYTKQKVTGDNPNANFKNVFFSPIQETTLVDAKVRYMLTRDKCFRFDTKKSKELLTVFDQKWDFSSSTVYLGIESDLTTIPLDTVSMYIEHQGVSDKELFYYHLRNAKWYMGDTALDVIDGYWNSEKESTIDLDTIFGGISSKTTTIQKQVKDFYKKHYVTFKSQNGLTAEHMFPELQEILEQHKKTITGDIKWLKIVFPTVLGAASLDKLFCSLNTFPVLNRRKEHFSYQMKNFINIIPIVSENLFLDIKEVTNTKADRYELQHTSATPSDKGTYYLRNFNVGKLDSRGAKEHIQNLLQLLKNESAAFSFFNQDFLESKIKQLNQTIAILDQKTSELVDDTEYTNHIYINPLTKAETILVDYWTTNGTEANTIKSGTGLDIYEGTDLQQKNGYLVTPVFGGQDKLSMEQRLNSYRRISLSRNRIITAEDIKALCYELYNDKITGVTIRKGFIKDIGMKKGLVQCIEISITPNKQTKTAAYEWEYLNENLMSVLKKQSINIYPFNVVIENTKQTVAL